MVKLKKLKDQVMVITGASSGIGLTTARLAARRGARLVLAARSENALRQLTNDIKRQGGQAVYVVADVGKQEDVRGIARKAQEAFGGFDTWVNNAGVGIFGKLEEVPIEDMRHLFETNFWGIVYGSLEAVKHLKKRGNGAGGALINVGSTVSERALRLQGIYSTSKHAIKGFTDGLRMELEADNAPISVTLIKPAAIDTPFARNAKNYMNREATLPPPVYAPETVAGAILHCAETPVRDVFVGAGGKGLAALGQYVPRLTDRVMSTDMFAGMQKKPYRPTRPRSANGLDRASEHLAERGDYEGHVAETSLYTQATLHPVLAGAALVGTGLAVAALLQRASQSKTSVGATAESGAMRVEKSITINRSPEELYQFWRDFKNLPRFMNHLESVSVQDSKGSHWVAKAPAGTTVEWDAEITKEQRNEMIAWRSLEGADVDNSGSVRFERATGGRGTVVKVEIEYSPPGGAIGAGIAKLFGEEPSQQVQEDLRRFKQMMEAGEIPTTEGQSSGRA